MEGKASILIIGTSHISERSAKDIAAAFERFEPDIVAVELDRRRLQSLLTRKPGEKPQLPLSMIRKVGVTGYIFLKLGAYVQQKLAGVVKVEPGVDMLSAVTLARERKKLLVLADQDVLVTTAKLSKAFTFKEKLRVVWDAMAGPLRKELANFPLERVPDAKTIRKLMDVLKRRYPSLYDVLIIQRNVHMAAKVDQALRSRPGAKVLLVVGAGHEEDLRARLSRFHAVVGAE